jgi:hypothetical protein
MTFTTVTKAPRETTPRVLTFRRRSDGELLASDGPKLSFALSYGRKLRQIGSAPRSIVAQADKDHADAARALAFQSRRSYVDCSIELLRHDELAPWFALGRLDPAQDDHPIFKDIVRIAEDAP